MKEEPVKISKLSAYESMDLKHMENGMGGGGGTVGNTGTLSEIDFQRLAQTIATSIQKIVQNGNFSLKFFYKKHITTIISIQNYSFYYATYG